MGWHQADPIVFGPSYAKRDDCRKPHPELPGMVCGLPENHDEFEMMCGHWIPGDTLEERLDRAGQADEPVRTRDQYTLAD